ncbi:MAG: PP2C family serine/threonine-protein phosphatase [Christensenellales bacterium]|jgi:hypothetical protein
MDKAYSSHELHQSPVPEKPFRSGCLLVLPICIRGKSHEILNMPLQDACAVRSLPNGWVIAAVADGVGSEPRADEGAIIAAHAAVDFCADFFGYSLDDNSIFDLLQSAYQHATGEIHHKAACEGANVHEFSTTLHTAIFTGRTVYFGHAGDGGLIALCHNGNYTPLTQPQKGDDGEAVIPLLAGPQYWQFGRSDEPVFSVLLCTDGVFDKICSTILRKYADGIDMTLAGFFLSPYSFNWAKTSDEAVLAIMNKAFRDAKPNDFYPHIVKMIAQDGDEKIAQQFVLDHIIQRNRPLRMLQDIRDDISAVVLTQKGVFPDTVPIEKYTPPDWDKINAQIYAELYPDKNKMHKAETQLDPPLKDEPNPATPTVKDKP